MRFHITTCLSLAEIDQAFALIQHDAPTLTLPAWRHFARAARQKPKSAGLVAVKDARGYFSGLCTYRRVISLHHGAALAVDCFVALDFLNNHGVADQLLQHLEATALALECTALEITLARQDTRLIDQFRQSGHILEGVLLCKTLPAP
ncbi:MAG: hypothetical protein ACOVKO_06925 [Elstera sp.]